MADDRPPSFNPASQAPPPSYSAAQDHPAPPPTQAPSPLTALQRRFPTADPGLIQDILRSCGDDQTQAAAMLESMFSPAAAQPARPGPSAALQQLTAAFPDQSPDLVRDILESFQGDIGQATAALQALAAPPAEDPFTVLRSRFPDVEGEVVHDVLTQCGRDTDRAATMLATFSQAAPPLSDAHLVDLQRRFREYDPDTVRDVYTFCDREVDRASGMLASLAIEEAREVAPPPQPEVDPATITVDAGRSFREVDSSAQRRRLLIFLDDSGSMAGSNLRHAHTLFRKVMAGLGAVPSKVVLFGSKAHSRVLYDWDEPTQWEATLQSWSGKSGRTWLWECLLQFVGIEDPADLHILLITDGEDTESPAPLHGMQGMRPTVDSLNAMGFEGEIHLVAVGGDITIPLGKQYMALVGANGGVGAVMRQADEAAMDRFAEEFLKSVAVIGEAGAAAREARVREYVSRVKDGEAHAVPAQYARRIFGVDPELETLFYPRAEANELASQGRAERREAALEEARSQAIPAELRSILSRRRHVSEAQALADL